jgi:hypothetical protein
MSNAIVDVQLSDELVGVVLDEALAWSGLYGRH